MRVPRYYVSFRCIADRCRHSCCVGWEIDVDAQTLARYRALPGEIGENVRKSIEMSEGGAHFRLDAEERCPHLDARGLCRIITALGEGYLCEICREHPRFYHEIGGVWECGLGLACEEAARIVLDSEDYDEFAWIGEGEEEITPKTVGEFSAFARRAALYAALRDAAVPFALRLAEIECAYGLGVMPALAALFEDLEYLNERNRARFSRAVDVEFAPEGALATACERFFAYLVFRHASPAQSEREFACAVSLAACLTHLLYGLTSAGEESVVMCARVISEELEYSEENTAALCAALECAKKGG